MTYASGCYFRFVCAPWHCVLLYVPFGIVCLCLSPLVLYFYAPWHSLVLCFLLVPLGTVPLCVLLVLYPLYMKHQLSLCIIMSFRIVPLGTVPTHTLPFNENEMKVMIHGTVSVRYSFLNICELPDQSNFVVQRCDTHKMTEIYAYVWMLMRVK